MAKITIGNILNQKLEEIRNLNNCLPFCSGSGGNALVPNFFDIGNVRYIWQDNLWRVYVLRTVKTKVKPGFLIPNYDHTHEESLWVGVSYDNNRNLHIFIEGPWEKIIEEQIQKLEEELHSKDHESQHHIKHDARINKFRKEWKP